jgi:hypothetical protein
VYLNDARSLSLPGFSPSPPQATALEFGHDKAGAVSGTSGVSAGVSGASGKAAKGSHLLAGLDMINEGIASLADKIEAIRADLPEYEMQHKKGKGNVSGVSADVSGVSGGNRKHGLFGHN